jgi:hypothetical protein
MFDESQDGKTFYQMTEFLRRQFSTFSNIHSIIYTLSREADHGVIRTIERIILKAVAKATLMVEKVLKQVVSHKYLNTLVFLGFLQSHGITKENFESRGFELVHRDGAKATKMKR